MRPETETRVRNVQKFGKNGRQFCTLAAAMLGIYLFATWAKIAFGPWSDGSRIELGAFFRINADQLTTVSSKLWALSVVTVYLAILGSVLWHLYRLFKQLEAGSIYTKRNVHHLRQVGWLSMALAGFQLVLPALSFALAEIGAIDQTLVTFVAPANGAPMLMGYPLGGFINGALILLASWIMDVGTEIRDDADAMRREAELVSSR